jgi:sialate O-acetylesterase
MKIENDMTWFEVAGNDKNYFNAEVDVYKDFIQLFSEKVIDPKYVRYAWSDTASATLFNIEGLPGTPFSGEYLKLSDK